MNEGDFRCLHIFHLKTLEMHSNFQKFSTSVICDKIPGPTELAEPYFGANITVKNETSFKNETAIETSIEDETSANNKTSVKNETGPYYDDYNNH